MSGMISAAEALANHQNVRRGAQLLGRRRACQFGRGQPGISSKISSAPCIEQEARTCGQKVGRRRFDRGPAHRFGDQRADVALHIEHVVDVVGEAFERAVVAEKAACEIQRRRCSARPASSGRARAGTEPCRRRRSCPGWRRGTSPTAIASYGSRSRSAPV